MPDRQTDLAAAFVRLGSLGALLSLLALFGRTHFVAEQIASFRVHYLVALVPLIAAALLRCRYVAAAFLSAVLCIHGLGVVRLYLPTEPAESARGATLRVMTSNLFESNARHGAQVAHVHAVDPDVIVFQEYTPAWERTLSTRLPDHPHRLSLAIDSPFGIALYSKLPLVETELLWLPGSIGASVNAVLEVEGSRLRILGTHPPPPMSAYLFDQRNELLGALADLARADPGPLLLVGDLNTTPWSAHFGDLLRRGDLHDARRGFGVLPTWPGAAWPGRIPIDHILHDGTIVVSDLQRGAYLGSDHLSLWADVLLPERSAVSAGDLAGNARSIRSSRTTWSR